MVIPSAWLTLEDKRLSGVRLHAGGKRGRCPALGSTCRRLSVCSRLFLFSGVFQLSFLRQPLGFWSLLANLSTSSPQLQWGYLFSDPIKLPSCLQGVSCSVASSADSQSWSSSHQSNSQRLLFYSVSGACTLVADPDLDQLIPKSSFLCYYCFFLMLSKLTAPAPSIPGFPLASWLAFSEITTTPDLASILELPQKGGSQAFTSQPWLHCMHSHDYAACLYLVTFNSDGSHQAGYTLTSVMLLKVSVLCWQLLDTLLLAWAVAFWRYST